MQNGDKGLPSIILAGQCLLVKMLIILKTHHNYILIKGLGSRRGEIGPAIEMHNGLKYVYMVYFIEKNRNFICLVLKL